MQQCPLHFTYATIASKAKIWINDLIFLSENCLHSPENVTSPLYRKVAEWCRSAFWLPLWEPSELWLGSSVQHFFPLPPLMHKQSWHWNIHLNQNHKMSKAILWHIPRLFEAFTYLLFIVFNFTTYAWCEGPLAERQRILTEIIQSHSTQPQYWMLLFLALSSLDAASCEMLTRFSN